MKTKALLTKYAALPALFVAIAILETGCDTVREFVSTTQFSQSAYDTAKSVRAQSLALIDKAHDRTAYADFAKQDERLMDKFDSAIASEQARTKNRPTVEQWKTLKAEMRRFLDLWKSKGKLSPAFVDEEKEQVAKHFDILLKTEQEKRRR